MDHLDWYEFSTTDPVKVPYVCGDGPLCGGDEFFDFPRRQGWELDQSESLSQLAERAQAWLFFGLLAVVGIQPDACIDFNTGERLVNTKTLPGRLNFAKHTTEHRYLPIKLMPAFFKAETVMLEEVIPFVKDCEALESLDLWSSKPYAILFSIDTLLDSFKDALASFIKQYLMAERPRVSNRSIESEQFDMAIRIVLGNLRPGSLFPEQTEGVARSLVRTGRCGSLARRLDFTSSKSYHLMSLPNSQEREDHSLCSKTSCDYFNVDRTTYRTQHTRDCIMCDEVRVLESELVDLIQKNEVPVIRSTMHSNGIVTIRVEKMTKGVDYVAISHVWAGGLGNFVENQLPQCQLQAIHDDVGNTMVSRFSRVLPNCWAIRSLYPSILKPQRPGRFGWLSSSLKSTTFRYWIDTLCIPNNHPSERKSAINSMGRIYAGAAAVLVLDPALRNVSYDQLGATRAKMLIEASPWMARSWPLQEAALANEIYVKFSKGSVRFEHEHLGIETTLRSLPGPAPGNALSWVSGEGLNVGFVPGEFLPYTPNSDFANAWNLLAKRTTSHSEDVPAILATLIHKSAGEILSIDPAHRTWALLDSVGALPLDILCVEQESQAPRWAPRLPGSSKLVSTLDMKFGTLERIASGFLLQLAPRFTRALICPKGLSLSGGYFSLRDGHTKQSFLVYLPASPDTCSKAKAGHVEAEESHLILMLRKKLSGSSSSYGILCKIQGQAGDTLRVQLLSNTITWPHHNDREQLLAHETRDCLSIDPSCSIQVEMVRAYLDVLYFTHIRVAVDWRVRYYWSLSFWDVPEAKSTLSRILFSVPLYMIVVDLTIMAGGFRCIRGSVSRF
ncbi:hypothetical protein F5Y14DRAFT_451540 [Nemania sp. NC0429]|nr:hypothetical protein F5Y14DRAFT_451540 [Nemania sp. NC0429]